LRRGITIGKSRTSPAEIRMIDRTRQAGNNWYEVTLREGKNQQIRRMFDSIGHSVVKLRRVRIGHIADAGLAPGQHRELTSSEVKRFFQTPPKATSRKSPKATSRKTKDSKARRH